MKKKFNKKYLIENRNCYSEKLMLKLCEYYNNDVIEIEEILSEEKIPIYDKYFFVFARCEISENDVVFLVKNYLKKSIENVETINKESEIAKIGNLFLNSKINKKFKESLDDKYDKKILDLLKNLKNEEKYLAKSLICYSDLSKLIFEKKSRVEINAEASRAIKNANTSLVSRGDLKSDLLKSLKDFCS